MPLSYRLKGKVFDERYQATIGVNEIQPIFIIAKNTNVYGYTRGQLLSFTERKNAHYKKCKVFFREIGATTANEEAKVKSCKESTDGFIIIINSNDGTDKIKEDEKTYTEFIKSERLIRKTPIYVVINKSDKVTATMPEPKKIKPSQQHEDSHSRMSLKTNSWNNLEISSSSEPNSPAMILTEILISLIDIERTKQKIKPKGLLIATDEKK